MKSFDLLLFNNRNDVDLRFLSVVDRTLYPNDLKRVPRSPDC